MIKALMRGKLGHQMLLLGLSEENVKRLRDGQPIPIKPSQVELDSFKSIDAILITYSATEDKLAEDLERMLSSKGWLPVIQRGRNGDESR